MRSWVFRCWQKMPTNQLAVMRVTSTHRFSPLRNAKNDKITDNGRLNEFVLCGEANNSISNQLRNNSLFVLSWQVYYVSSAHYSMRRWENKAKRKDRRSWKVLFFTLIFCRLFRIDALLILMQRGHLMLCDIILHSFVGHRISHGSVQVRWKKFHWEPQVKRHATNVKRNEMSERRKSNENIENNRTKPSWFGMNESICLKLTFFDSKFSHQLFSLPIALFCHFFLFQLIWLLSSTLSPFRFLSFLLCASL